MSSRAIGRRPRPGVRRKEVGCQTAGATAAARVRSTRRTRGEAGYGHSSDLGRDDCTIRQYEITGAPYYTYCAGTIRTTIRRESTSRSGRCSRAIPTPTVGERAVAGHAPLRAKLLALIERIPVTWVEDYPSGLSFTEVVVMQLAEWRERAALPALERIASSTVEPQPPGLGPLARSPVLLIDAARRAIDQITADVD